LQEAKQLKKEQLETLREELLATKREGLHTARSIETRLRELSQVFEIGGRVNTHTVPGSEVVGMNGELYAIQITFQNGRNGHTDTDFITFELGEDRMGYYRDQYSNMIIETVALPDVFVEQWMKEVSEGTKIVKSRPAFMHPELFKLPPEDVFPPNADIAVIGDPFTAIDRERATIVEYEYASELLPPVLSAYISGSSETGTNNWLENLYFEDIRALEGVIFGPQFTPKDGNVYKDFVQDVIHACDELATTIATGAFNDTKAHGQLSELRRRAKKFIDGSWTMNDAKELYNMLGVNAETYNERKIEIISKDNPTLSREEVISYFKTNNAYQNLEKNITVFFETKQQQIDSLGNHEAWGEFVEQWSKYTEALPVEYLRVHDNEVNRKIGRLKYWLSELPNATSHARVTKGVREMEDIYFDWLVFYDQENPETDTLWNFRLNSNDRDFGVSVPGFPVSLRTRKTLEEFVSRFEQLTTYGETLFPQLVKEKERLEGIGISLTSKTLNQYLGDLEIAWSRTHFFRQPNKSIALHGFFPFDFPSIEPQDRILALTSVWMHEGEFLGQEGFSRNIECALPYLKIGGKYIIGPINKNAYFGGYGDGFDNEGLNRALIAFKEQGIISYKFQKGERTYINSLDDVYEEDERNKKYEQGNELELGEGEAAHSLVITRLK